MNVTGRKGSRRQAATIKEVADLAGVSQMTVSRVLNRSSVVREATREKVEKAIQELNYRPNLLARGLAGGGALFIGLIYNNPSNSYISEVLVGALNKCRAMGHYLVLEDCRADTSTDSSRDVVERIAAAGLDGVIVIPPLSESDALLDGLAAEGIPGVVIAPRLGREDFASVSIDDHAATIAMMQVLFDAGHADIAFIRGDEGQSAARRRHRGYVSALKARGIAVREDWVRPGDFNYRSGMAAAQQLLKTSPMPSVIFACNDDMAAGAVAAVQAEGLKVPLDISVVGFDDSAIASGIWPALTTVRQPIAEMVSSAVELLSQLISEGPESERGRNVVLDVEIIHRESLARRS